MVRRRLSRLTAKTVANQRQPGYYADGGGLYLQVSSSGTKSWIFRFTLNGRAREMGLGAASVFTLAEARERALAARRLLADGVDPIESRRAARAQTALERARALTFAEASAAYIAAHRAAWRNSKHAEQWIRTLELYATPINALAVGAIDTGLVLQALEPIWTTKTETATRVRARIERILDWATVRGYRSGDNPARWRGHLDQLLPTLSKRKRVQHFHALPYAELPAFILELRALPGTGARALEFLILTATRTGEVAHARRNEFDLDAGVWTIPAERTKAHRAHRVPLAPRAVEILRALGDEGPYAFPGLRARQPLSTATMASVLRRMARTDITVHGFRSTFRDWTAEQTNYPREVCEMALGHAISDQVEAAYRRGDLFEKRRRLMNEWARYCEQRPRAGKVTPIRKTG